MKKDLVIISTILLMLAIQVGHAKVFKTQQQALQEAFPNNDLIERKTLFLTTPQVNQIQKLAKAKLESKIVTFYVGKKADSLMGYAFFESNIVRTRPETLPSRVRHPLERRVR